MTTDIKADIATVYSVLNDGWDRQRHAQATAALSRLEQRIAELEIRDEGMAEAWADYHKRLHKLGECDTCDGSGMMEVVVGYDAPDEREITKLEPCADCEGVSKAARDERESVADRIRREAVEECLNAVSATSVFLNDAPTAVRVRCRNNVRSLLEKGEPTP